jgi:hypothetical protein
MLGVATHPQRGRKRPCWIRSHDQPGPCKPCWRPTAPWRRPWPGMRRSCRMRPRSRTPSGATELVDAFGPAGHMPYLPGWLPRMMPLPADRSTEDASTRCTPTDQGRPLPERSRLSRGSHSFQILPLPERGTSRRSGARRERGCCQNMAFSVRSWRTSATVMQCRSGMFSQRCTLLQEPPEEVI